MGGIDIDLSEFDDPAPVPLKSQPHPFENESSSEEDTQPRRRKGGERQPKKRKLPFRADVVVEGKRYKGKKVTRTDADLDLDTLGLEGGDDDGEGVDEPEDRTRDATDADDDGLADANGEQDEFEEDGWERSDTDAKAGGEPDGDGDSEKLDDEERAVAARLAHVEEKERERAIAVKKQKQVYDSVVNLRIRIEPLMALVRQLPSAEQKKECSDWTSSDMFKEDQDKAENLLENLIQKVEEAWEDSFPSGEEATNPDFESWRDGVLDTWGRKVDEAAGVVPKGGFKKLDTTVSAQLKASLATGKHLEKMQRVKEAFPLVGKDLEMAQGSNNMHFDDGDFYRTLLREVIESGEGVGGGLRYAQLSKSGKVKKKRDRSFAKGKRLKYDVHEKIVGFLAPVPLPDPGPVEEIVAALFGKRGTVVVNAEE